MLSPPSHTNVGMIFRISTRHDFVLLYMNNSPQWAIEEERIAVFYNRIYTYAGTDQ